jgi:hypothetical protein
MNRPVVSCIKRPELLVVVLRGKIYNFRCKGTKIRAAVSLTNFLTKDYFYPNIQVQSGIHKHSLHYFKTYW